MKKTRGKIEPQNHTELIFENEYMKKTGANLAGLLALPGRLGGFRHVPPAKRRNH